MAVPWPPSLLLVSFTSGTVGSSTPLINCIEQLIADAHTARLPPLADAHHPGADLGCRCDHRRGCARCGVVAVDFVEGIIIIVVIDLIAYPMSAQTPTPTHAQSCYRPHAIAGVRQPNRRAPPQSFRTTWPPQIACGHQFSEIYSYIQYFTIDYLIIVLIFNFIKIEDISENAANGSS